MSSKKFKMENIPPKFFALIGKNGMGKSTILELMNQSINQNPESYFAKYFSSSEDKINSFNDLPTLNKKIKTFPGKTKEELSNFLYESINDFSLIEYFDYLLCLDYKKDDFELIEKIFPFSFNEERMEERKIQQLEYLTNKENYYNGRLIEHYLTVSDNHKLSPGEYLILLIELWRIHARKLEEENKEKRPIFNKLRILLLDEPDAHMHPSLIKKFIELLTNNALKYLNLQVIMVTHNPVTISFIKTENIFELTKENEERVIKRVENKSQLIHEAADELFYIKEKFKIVFIEGKIGDDESFYRLVFDKLNKTDESKKLSIKFQGMGDREFNQIFLKKTNVTQDSEKNLNEFIFGINDGDFNIPKAYECLIGSKEWNKEVKDKPICKFNSNYRRLERYNIENYIYDPINLFFALKYLLGDKKLQSKKVFKNEDKKYYDEILNFFKVIEESKNICDFIKNNNNWITIFNEFLKNTNNFYLSKLANHQRNQNKMVKQKDKYKTFQETFQINGQNLTEKLSKPIEVEFNDPLFYNSASSNLIKLTYFPIQLYCNGKHLYDLISEILSEFYDLIQITELEDVCAALKSDRMKKNRLLFKAAKIQTNINIEINDEITNKCELNNPFSNFYVDDYSEMRTFLEKYNYQFDDEIKVKMKEFKINVDSNEEINCSEDSLNKIDQWFKGEFDSLSELDKKQLDDLNLKSLITKKKIIETFYKSGFLIDLGLENIMRSIIDKKH